MLEKIAETEIVGQLFLLSKTNMSECSFLLQWEYVLLGDYRKRLLDERHMVGIIRCVRRDETKQRG